MLLDTLHIVNFRSHKNTTARFQTGTTVIVGDNGSGKSTIIDAVLFALSGEKWEKREGLKLDNFIRWNNERMSVSLTFAADGVKYRVQRSKILNRSTAASVDIWDENNKFWKNLANRQRGVDEKLGEILNLNEINTSVVRQGELTRILQLKPRERKEYFHKLLNLEEMEKFYGDFRKYVEDYKNEANKLAGKISGENEKKNRLDERQKEKESLKRQRDDLEKEIEKLKDDVEGKKRLCDEAEAKKDRHQKISNEIYISENNIKNVQRIIDEKEKELKEIEEIEKKIPELREDAKKFETLKVKRDEAGKILNLKNQYITLKDQEKEYNRHNSKISELQQAESDYNIISKDIENLKEKISELKISVEDIKRLDKQEEETKKKIIYCRNYIKDTGERYFSIFSEVCDLEKIKKIPEHREILQKEIAELMKERENFKGREQGLNATLKILDEQKRALNKEIEKAKNACNETEKKKNICDDYIKETEERYFRIFNKGCNLEKIKNIPAERENLRKEIESLMKERENFNGKQQELNVTLKNLEKQKNELLKTESVCPVCESPLPDNKKANLLENIAENNEKAVNELKEIKAKIKETDLNKNNKDKIQKDIEDINTDWFIAKYNERAELNRDLEEIKKDKADKEAKEKEYEDDEYKKNRELEENRNALKNFEFTKNKHEERLKAVENINSELFVEKHKEINELNTLTEKIKEDKIKVNTKKKEYEEYITRLNGKNKIFNELKKKHDDYIYSKKFVEGTNIKAINKDTEKISGEINAIIQTQNLPCTVEDVEHYITETKKQLDALERNNKLLSRYEGEIKNKNEIIKITGEEKTTYENLLMSKDELTAKRTEINYSEEKHKGIKKDCEDVGKRHQEADKNLGITKTNIENCETVIGEINADLEKIEGAKKEEEILNAFINFSTKIRDGFGRNGMQKDISQSFFPILEMYANNLFSTFGFPYDGVEIFEDEENCNINLKKENNTISSASLSGGEKSALSIALNAALSKIIGKADFLILDEPTESLDEGKIGELIEILKEFKGVSQLIVISHDRDFKNATRSRLEIYKEDGISYIAGEESENKEDGEDGEDDDKDDEDGEDDDKDDEDGEDGEDGEDDESKGVKNLTNTQQGLFEF